MKTALLDIHEQLLKSGMEDDEADVLVSRLFEEEAYDYVSFMSYVKNELTDEEREELALEVKSEINRRMS